MKTITSKQQVWNSAAKDGAILACITIAASAINIVMSKATGTNPSSGGTMLVMAVSSLVWIAKTVGSFLLLRKQIFDFGKAYGNPSKCFGYGIKVTLLSSFLCAVFVAVNLLYISPDSLSETWDLMMQLYDGKLDSNSMEMLEGMRDYLPAYSAIGQFAWIFILGIIYSAVISSMRKNSAPFETGTAEER